MRIDVDQKALLASLVAMVFSVLTICIVYAEIDEKRLESIVELKRLETIRTLGVKEKGLKVKLSEINSKRKDR